MASRSRESVGEDTAPTHGDRLAVLRRCPLFAAWPEARLADLARIARTADVAARLASRSTRTVGDFGAAMDVRAARYGHADYAPSGPIADLFPNAFYLLKVDKEYRRSYGRAPSKP